MKPSPQEIAKSEVGLKSVHPDPDGAKSFRKESNRQRLVRSKRIRRWSFGLADVASVCLGIVAAMLVGKYNPGNPYWFLLVIPIWVVSAKIMGLYDADDRRSFHSTSMELPNLIATGAISVVLFRILTLPLEPPINTTGVLVVGGTAIFAALIIRGLIRVYWSRHMPLEQALVVGSGPRAARVVKRIIENGSINNRLELIGRVSDDSQPSFSPSKSGNSEDVSELVIPDLGDVQSLSSILTQEGITRVFIAEEPENVNKCGSIIDLCLSKDVTATLVPVESSILGPASELGRLADLPVIEFHSTGIPRSTRFLKRVTDIFLGSILLVLTAPILMPAVIAVKLTSKGPAFFLHRRSGRNGKTFDLIKIRTMYDGAEEKLGELLDTHSSESLSFKVAEDPRVTPVGRVLRNSSIDELPQLINVIKGEMSLVGPRPKIPTEAALYQQRESRILDVRPGVTGPMQVSGRGLLSFEERLALERDYLESISLTRDFGILLATPGAVISGNGARNL